VALTNAEKQAAWRERRDQRVKELEQRIAELEAEIERLRRRLNVTVATDVAPASGKQLRNQVAVVESRIDLTSMPRAARTQEREEIARKMQEGFARGRAESDPAKRISRLKTDAANAHPDRGGTNEGFHKAHTEYVRGREQIETDQEWRAKRRAQAELHSPALLTVWAISATTKLSATTKP
jgi:DNA repair exonuclease SbcCD ATPase subunit